MPGKSQEVFFNVPTLDYVTTCEQHRLANHLLVNRNFGDLTSGVILGIFKGADFENELIFCINGQV